LVAILSLASSILTFTIVFVLATALRIEEPYGFFLALLYSLAPMIVGVWETELSGFFKINKETT
jgi:uncharacterized membrane protein